MTHRATVTLAAILLLPPAAPAPAAYINAHHPCAAAKLAATATAFVCLAKGKNEELLSGTPADLGACSATLAAVFGRAETEGDCPVDGDAGRAEFVATSAETGVLAALLADTAASGRQTSCAVAKNRAGAKYAACTARELTRLIKGHAATSSARFDSCYDKLKRSFDRQDARGGCLTSNDADGIVALLGPVAAYLENADLGGMDLRYANLAYADLRDASLHEADLSYANLRGLHLEDQVMTGIRGVDLSHCPDSLPYRMVCRSNILLGPWVNLVGADLGGMDLRDIALEGADLGSANLSAADLSGADLRWADLGDADLSGANLDGALLRDADLSGGNLAGVDLDAQDLTDVRAVALANCPASLPAGWVCRGNTLLGPGAEVSRADLSGISLSDLDLSGVRASRLLGCPASLPPEWECRSNALLGPGANLRSVNLHGADLSGLNLSGVFLENSDLGLANLAGTNLSDADLGLRDSYPLGVSMYGANLTGANLTGAHGSPVLIDANLSGANLTNAVFDRAWLLRTNLSGAILANLDLDGAELAQVDLGGLDMSGTLLAGVSATDLLGCPASLPPQWNCKAETLLGPGAALRGIRLDGRDLSGVDLSGAELTGAHLSGANLASANLSGTYLYSADLSNADLSDSVLVHTYFSSANLSGANLQNSNMSEAYLFMADLSNADLSGADLNHASLRHANLGGANLSAIASWVMTVCADGTMSPGGSCCGHHEGAAPANCSP